jgi:predicted DNA-binding transcriptional regulator YafY
MLNLLLKLEQRRQGLTIAEMEEQLDLGCSRRTLYRDLQQLEDMFYINVDEDGRYTLKQPSKGAWSVLIDPSMVVALELSQGLLGPLRETALAAPLDELRARLLAMLPPQAPEALEKLRQSLLGTTFAATDYGAKAQVIQEAQSGIDEQQKLRIVYAKPGEEPRARIVRPHLMWVTKGALYLVGIDEDAEDWRTFAVQRILEAEVLDDGFEPDPNFDPEHFTQRGFGVFHGPKHDVVLVLEAEVAYVAHERKLHPTQKLQKLPEGRLKVTMEAAGLPEIAAWVASFGGRIRPVAPRELVEKVRSIHQRGLESLSRGPVTAKVTTSDDKPPR